MAERRMFAKTIIDSDAFLDMPISTRLLYFDLSMRADDDGFVNSPKKIIRMTGASDDDLRLLIAKNFIIPFESGVVVIKHWKIHNYIQKDRYKKTMYLKEKSLLSENECKEYTLDTNCIQDVSTVDTQVREGKSKLRKGESESKVQKGRKKATEVALTPTLSDLENRFSDTLSKAILDWCTYKHQRNENYTPIGLKSLLTQIENSVKQYDEQAVINLIYHCMSNNWKGIIFDRLKKVQADCNAQEQSVTGNPFADALLLAQGGGTI